MAVNEENEIIRDFISTNSRIISYINDQAKKGRCVKRETLSKQFSLGDKELDLHMKLIHDIDDFLIPINKKEYCSRLGLSEAMKRIQAI